MACAPDADPAVPRDQAGVGADLERKECGTQGPPCLGPDQNPHSFRMRTVMKKIVSHARVTRSARRTAPAQAAPRLPARRFQYRDRQRRNLGPPTAGPRRLPQVMRDDVGMLRMPALRRQYPRSRSTIYGDIRAGRFTPPVALGPRCSAWPAHEVGQIIAAHAAGASDREIRQLVARLIAERCSSIQT